MVRPGLAVRTIVGVGVVLALILAIVAGDPATGHDGGDEHVKFAHDADTVDDLHARRATSAAGARANKLIAADANGFLPNNIIKMAKNSKKLGGLKLNQATPFLTGAFDGEDTVATAIDHPLGAEFVLHTALLDPPGPGVALIHGSVVVTAESTTEVNFLPTIEGTSLPGAGAEEKLTAGENETMSYTAIALVEPGPTDIEIGQGLTMESEDDFSFNREALVVQFYPIQRAD